MADTIALIVAAGRGERAQRGGHARGSPSSGKAPPKQYRPLAGKPVLRWAVEAFLGHPAVSAVQVVIRSEDRSDYESATSRLALETAVLGGATRQESVRHGLEALAASPPRRVLIHDGARPLVSAALIARVAGALEHAVAVAPLLGVSDTLRTRTEAGYAIVPREELLRAQTPQGFAFAAILDAHRRFAHESVTDDFAMAQRAGLSLGEVTGEEINIKLTTAEDFVLAQRLAASA